MEFFNGTCDGSIRQFGLLLSLKILRWLKERKMSLRCKTNDNRYNSIYLVGTKVSDGHGSQTLDTRVGIEREQET